MDVKSDSGTGPKVLSDFAADALIKHGLIDSTRQVLDA